LSFRDLQKMWVGEKGRDVEKGGKKKKFEKSGKQGAQETGKVFRLGKKRVAALFA